MKTTVRFAALALVVATVMFTVSCGGNANKKKAADGATETAQTETTAPAKEGAMTTVPREKINTSSTAWTTPEERDAVIAEIPAEMFKVFGEVDDCRISKSNTPGYKYTLAIRVNNPDGKAAVEKQLEYYKSIGATINEENKELILDYAKSVELVGYSSFYNIMFNVVKQ